MRIRWLALIFLVLPLTGWSMVRGEGLEPLPTDGERTVVARVNGDAIYLDEVLGALAAGAAPTAGSDTMPRHDDPESVLDRLVNARLIVQEATAIGLQDLPEVRRGIDARRLVVLRNLLFADRLRAVEEPDPVEVERLYRFIVEKVRIRALFIESEAAADEYRQRGAGGIGFDQFADGLVAAGRATETPASGFVSLSALHPEVREALADLEPGQASPAVRIPEGWAAVKLIERRIPDDPAARKEARQQLLATERQATIRAYADELKQTLTRTDEAVLVSVDLEVDGPGLASYKDDTRVVATVENGEPVTVAELASVLETKFFHGAERAAERGGLERRKRAVLEEILDKRVVVVEATRQGLEDSAEFRRRMQEIEDGMLFGAFIGKVIEPDLAVGDSDLIEYIKDHRDRYLTPAMIRLDVLAFSDPAAARDAVEKLRRGADRDWLRSNAEGVVEPSEDDPVGGLRGQLVLVSTLPADLREAIVGARQDDYRLLERDDPPTYVVTVLESIPERLQDLEGVRGQVKAQVLAEKRQAAAMEYAVKLREVSEVEIYARGDRLRSLILAELGAGG
jgi:peptidyl-prolyl cis-trans isomerase C